MRTSKIIHVVTCHAEGEVGDVIVGGGAPPPGETVWEQSRFIAKDGALRNFVLNGPYGGVFRHVNLLVPAKDTRAQMGFIIEDTPPMSGSNAICVATVRLDVGILPMQEPQIHLTLEAPGGLVAVTAECRNGKAQRVSIENAPSFADRLDAPLEVAGLGALKVDIAYDGDSFVIVEAAALDLVIAPDQARDLEEMGVRTTAAADEQLGFSHPEAQAWDHISFCQFAGPLEREGNELRGPNAVVVRPGKIDRSPPDHGRRPDGHPPNCFGPGLDYRRQPVYAGPGRSVAAIGSRTLKGGNLSVLRGSRSRLKRKMAMKYPVHDLLSLSQPDFKNFVRRLA